MARALSTPTTTLAGIRRGNHCISTSMEPTSTFARSTSRSERSGALPPKRYPAAASSASVRAMLLKYLSEYQPCRIRSTSSLKTDAGKRRRSKTVMDDDYGRICLTWAGGGAEARVVDIVDHAAGRRRRLLAAAAVALLAAVVSGESAEPAPSDPRADPARVLAALDAAWRARDADAYLRLWRLPTAAAEDIERS